MSGDLPIHYDFIKLNNLACKYSINLDNIHACCHLKKKNCDAIRNKKECFGSFLIYNCLLKNLHQAFIVSKIYTFKHKNFFFLFFFWGGGGGGGGARGLIEHFR